MFIVKIMGGLGNQLFQYCLALRLQAAGKDVALETTAFPGDAYKRQYQLNMLPARVPLLDDAAARLRCSPQNQTLVNLVEPRPRPASLLRDLWAKTPIWRQRQARKRKQAAHWRDVLAHTETGDAHVIGHWQESAMVNPDSPLIKDLISLRQSVEIPEEMQQATVAVHVRNLWNYDANGKFVAALNDDKHGYVFLSPEYYAQSMRRVAETIANPVFAIFSDNPDWCVENILPLASPGSFVVPASVRPDWQDLLIMSRFPALIIANSTFSWWSGAICDGLVVAPANWHKFGAFNQTMHRAEWARI